MSWIESGPRPPIPPRSECRDCAFPILFVKVGKSLIPVNPLPDDKGNVAAMVIGSSLHGYVLSKTQPWRAPYLLMMPHHATCEAVERKASPPDDPALFEFTTTEGAQPS